MSSQLDLLDFSPVMHCSVSVDSLPSAGQQNHERWEMEGTEKPKWNSNKYNGQRTNRSAKTKSKLTAWWTTPLENCATVC